MKNCEYSTEERKEAKRVTRHLLYQEVRKRAFKSEQDLVKTRKLLQEARGSLDAEVATTEFLKGRIEHLEKVLKGQEEPKEIPQTMTDIVEQLAEQADSTQPLKEEAGA